MIYKLFFVTHPVGSLKIHIQQECWKATKQGETKTIKNIQRVISIILKQGGHKVEK